MEFSWTEQQLALKEAVLRFAQDSLNDAVANDDHETRFPREKWQACAEFGLLKLAVSPSYGGEGRDMLTTLLAFEALGYGCSDNGLAFAVNGHLLTVSMTIEHFGNEDQKRRWLPGLGDGSIIGAQAITERDAGSDAFSLSATATKDGDGYRLNGEKMYITLGPVADMVMVFATVDPSLGRWGVTPFLVRTDTKGVSVGANEAKMGLRTVPFGGLRLDDCYVPAADRLGGEGAGAAIANGALEWERAGVLATQVGAMGRQLDRTVAYAREREQFGQPIGKFQSVSNRIVDMRMRLETAQLMLYKAAWTKQAGEPAMLLAALAKLHLSESFIASGLDAVRIHGAQGYLSEFGVERDLRDAIGGVIYGGTSDIQRVIVARLLGL